MKKIIWTIFGEKIINSEREFLCQDENYIQNFKNTFTQFCFKIHKNQLIFCDSLGVFHGHSGGNRKKKKNISFVFLLDVKIGTITYQ